jgi:PAS domain S-box-containing protein
MALYKHKIEQQLREREQWLATTLKSIGDAVITTDSQGLVTFMNPVAEALTRWNSEEVIGNDLSQVFHAINEKTREAIENPINLVLQEGIT